MSSLLEQASLVVTPNGTKASKLYSVKPTDGSGDMTVVRATTATRVNSSGLIESVATNVPRLDYTGSTCPSILVEPQRTNDSTYSEDFSNAVYTKDNLSITANSIASPDGTTNADKLVESANVNFHRATYIASVIDTTYAVSVFAKKAERDYLVIRTSISGTNVNSCFDLNNGSVIFNGHLSSSIVDYGNGWYRCIVTQTSATSTTRTIGFMISDTSVTNNNIPSYSGDGTSGLYLWGSQIEAGANATSYIPTTTASVTRNSDLISKTGITDLIGQTEGTLFVDYNRSLSVPSALGILEIGILNDEISITQSTVEQLRFFVRVGGSIIGGLQTVSVSTDNIKIALKYSSTSYSVFVNGNLALNNISISSLSTSYNGIVLGNRFSSSNYLNSDINSVSLWKTALTDQECITLTTL